VRTCVTYVFSIADSNHLLGDDLLRVVEEVQLLGKVMDKIDVTFLTLISKSEFPNSFDEYKPISFCNYVYKVISKVIASRLKPTLSNYTLKKQFGFYKAIKFMNQ